MNRIARRSLLIASLLAALSGCSGGGGGSTIPAPPTATDGTATQAIRPGAPPPATATPTASAQLSGASAAYLSLDLAHLANYARPALPPFYGPNTIDEDNTPASNPVTDAGATLGRVLFNDKRLSVDGAISCASCHQQAKGFTDPARFSVGFSGSAFTSAHAMRLANVRYYEPGTMFWDKRAASVEAQALVPIQNSVEMGYDSAHGGLNALIASMNALPYYPELFKFVYGDATITSDRISASLAQFERSIVSTQSRWDVGMSQVFNAAPPAPGANPFDVNLPNLTAQENRGAHLFLAAPQAGGVGCAACHSPPTFALSATSLSNGLDAGQTTVFKAPSLKNVGVTGPYMHDGRFATLADVVDFYDHGIQAGPSLDPRLTRNGQPVRLNLSAADKAAIVAFLQTLTDTVVTTDPKFASPFKK